MRAPIEAHLEAVCRSTAGAMYLTPGAESAFCTAFAWLGDSTAAPPKYVLFTAVIEPAISPL